MELTTYRGHANVFGLSEWVDFRIKGSEEVQECINKVDQEEGGMTSLKYYNLIGQEQ